MNLKYKTKKDIRVISINVIGNKENFCKGSNKI